jgi:hypothetical protein
MGENRFKISSFIALPRPFKEQKHLLDEVLEKQRR